MSFNVYNFLRENIENINIEINFHQLEISGLLNYYTFCNGFDCLNCSSKEKCDSFFDHKRPLLTELEFEKIKHQYPEYFI